MYDCAGSYILSQTDYTCCDVHWYAYVHDYINNLQLVYNQVYCKLYINFSKFTLIHCNSAVTFYYKLDGILVNINVSENFL